MTGHVHWQSRPSGAEFRGHAPPRAARLSGACAGLGMVAHSVRCRFAAFQRHLANKSREAASARQGAICITACERPQGAKLAEHRHNGIRAWRARLPLAMTEQEKVA